MTMKERILQKVEESFQKAEAFYGRTFSRPETYIWKRNGRVAGHSCLGRKELMFQLDLAEHHGDMFINRTPAHEVAHYIQKQLYPLSASHGPEWKFIMERVMKQEANRCHRYDTSVTKTRRRCRQSRYEYTCGCNKTFQISQTRHNKIAKGSAYFCKGCGGKIRLKNPETPNKESAFSIQRKIQLLQSELLKQQARASKSAH